MFFVPYLNSYQLKFLLILKWTLPHLFNPSKVEQASVQSHTPVQEKKHPKIKIAITSKILFIQKREQIRRWKEVKIINFKK
jgi:hypothetical protein